MSPEKRYRYVALTLRQEGDGRTLEGTLVAYGEVAPGRGERIDPGAFGDLSNVDAILNVQHDRARPLARSGAGLELRDSGEALTVSATLPRLTDRRYAVIVGPAGTGKTTFLRHLKAAFGPLAQSLPADVFERHNHNSALADVIENRPRFLILPEAGGATVEAELLNALTGEDELTTRRPYAKGDTSGTVHGLAIMAGETPPNLKRMTTGSIDRQLVVPWSMPVAKDARFRLDPDVYANDCFAWVLRGAREYLDMKSLGAPPAILRAAGEEAIDQQDPFIAWAGRREEELGGQTASAILSQWKASDGGEDCKMSPSSVSRALRRVGWTPQRSAAGTKLLPGPGATT